MGVIIVRLKEALRDNPRTFCDYRQCKLVIRSDMDVDWSPLDMVATSILEILIPNDVLEARYSVPRPDGPSARGCLVQHDPQVSEHVHYSCRRHCRSAPFRIFSKCYATLNP